MKARVSFQRFSASQFPPSQIRTQLHPQFTHSRTSPAHFIFNTFDFPSFQFLLVTSLPYTRLPKAFSAKVTKTPRREWHPRHSTLSTRHFPLTPFFPFTLNDCCEGLQHLPELSSLFPLHTTHIAVSPLF